MLHRETNLIIKKPIVVISGANGSGKTQLLEAVLVLLGEKSPRTKKGIFSLIGKYDKTAIVEIEVNNKKPDGTFIFQPIESDIIDFLIKDTISFRAIISESKISRSIGDSKTGKYKEISLRILQRLFSQLGIRSGNQLTFTLGETVDVFSNQSNHKKFQVLIENLGLAELKEEIINNEKNIRESIDNTSKLQRKLKDEENNLELFRTMIDAINQREKLESLLSSLTIERQWVEVVELEHLLLTKESELLVFKTQYLNEKKIVEGLEKNLEQKKIQRSDYQTKVRNCREERNFIEVETKNLTKIKNTSEATIKLLNDQIQDYLLEIDTLKNNFKDKNSKIILQDKLQDLQVKHSNIKEHFRNLTSEIEILKPEKQESREFLPNFEITLREESIKFKKGIIENHLQDTILGPLISLINLTAPERNKSWLPAILQSLGSYLYSFIALDPQSFKKSKELFDKIWPDRKPNFDVFRFDSQDQKRHNLTPEIFAFVPDLLEGDSRVLLMLRKISTTALAEERDANILLNAAILSGLDILTKDGNSFYRRKGSFSRPPRQFKGELGKEVIESNSVKDLKKQRKKLDEELFQTKREETSIMKEIAEIREKLNLFSGSNSQLNYQVDSVLSRLKKAELKLYETQDSLKNIIIQFEQNEKLLKEKKIEEKGMQDQLENIEKELVALETNLANARERLNQKNNVFIQAFNIVKETKEKILTAEDHALKTGDRPLEIREKLEVDLELKEVTTKLALVKDKSIPKEKLDDQEKRVVELRDNLEKRRDHLENLREDIEKRMNQWKQQIEPFIINLGEKLKELTQNIFSNVKLEIDSNDLEKAGLELKAVTKGDFRTDQSLSGGEKVLLMECLILALHALTTSPLHVIDEFTQRLDTKNKSKIYSIVKKMLDESNNTQFILITPDTLGLELDNTIQHVVITQAELVTQ
jgi:chromosome segregation ATPase